MKTNFWIVILFAFIHAVAAECSGYLGLHGGPTLTACTLLMVAILGYKGKVSTTFTTGLAIIVCFGGFIIGKGLLNVISSFDFPRIVQSTLPTIISTIVLGFSACYIINVLGPDFRVDKWSKKDIVIMTIFLILFLEVRSLVTRRAYASDGITEMDVFQEILGHSETLAAILIANIGAVVLVGSVRKKYGEKYSNALLWISIILLSVFAAFLPFKFGLTSDAVILLAEGLVAELSIFCMVAVVYYSFRSRKLIREEKDKRHMAEFKYSSLKQQVNPHFLFNSLNVLYGLMYEDKKEGAMSYTQKLASLYRYILESEEEPLVTLEREMEFAGKFVDMLSVRHENAFRIHFDIKQEDIVKHVPPCSVQTCLENVFKHNAVTKNNPLEIDVYSDGSRVYVKNNIIPRQSEPSSTHVGLNYIKKVYKDLGSEEIIIDKNNEYFTISLPLI